MIDGLRFALHRALTSPAGDAFAPLRLQKDLARRLNTLLGKPLCDEGELTRRREARARLAALRAGKPVAGAPGGAPVAVAPVTVYFEKNRNSRELERITELLTSKGIAHRTLDVAGDEATLTFVTQAARCEADDLPIVFVGSTAIGPYPRLVEADVSGALVAALSGAASGVASAPAGTGAPASQSPRVSQ